MSSSLVDGRRRAGLTQGRLGELVGVDQTTIANLERGRRLPSLPLLQRIRRRLALTDHELGRALDELVPDDAPAATAAA